LKDKPASANGREAQALPSSRAGYPHARQLTANEETLAQSIKLQTKRTPGASIGETEPGTLRLQIPAGPAGRYRLAQLDDYSGMPRKSFPWHPGSGLQVQMRASSTTSPGTWGIGFWNNPFGLAILTGVERLRLPVLPQAAWYFFASAPNYLSFRDDLPAQGALAATFKSPGRSNPWLFLAIPFLPLLVIPPAARKLRRLIPKIVQQDSQNLPIDPTLWHEYRLEWQEERASFQIDSQTLFETPTAPHASLGFVVWVDNQYAAFSPDGRLQFGSLANSEPAWIELRQLSINGQEPVF
jgi:hypothetical protein